MAPTPALPPLDIISPAEMKTWQEWAAKAPGLIRRPFMEEADKIDAAATRYKMGSVALGAALGTFSVTKMVPGKWKYASGAAALGALGTGWFLHKIQQTSTELKQAYASYADALETNPELQQQLADFLSTHVTAQDIQTMGIEKAIFHQTALFGTQTPYLPLVGKNYVIDAPKDMANVFSR